MQILIKNKDFHASNDFICNILTSIKYSDSIACLSVFLFYNISYMVTKLTKNLNNTWVMGTVRVIGTTYISVADADPDPDPIFSHPDP